MYKFEKNNEMKQLEELFNCGRIRNVILNYENRMVKVRKFNDEWLLTDSEGWNSYRAVNWEETAKLVKGDTNPIINEGIKLSENGGFIPKEEKMARIVVRDWGDLKEHIVTNYPTVKQVKINYGDMDLHFCNGEVEKCVKVINALGGNFVYEAVEVIDTLEKWEEYQDNPLSRNNFYFNRVKGNFFELFQDKVLKTFTIEEMEKRNNVDLQILK